MYFESRSKRICLLIKYRVLEESSMTPWFGNLSNEITELPFIELEKTAWGVGFQDELNQVHFDVC